MMLTLAEVADDLRVTERAVRKWIYSGHIEATKAGIGATSPWRISEEELAKFKKQRASKAAS